ncbi:CRISPR-associated endonuclease Cas1 [Thermobrachium celere]|uniref:CRISPR-associated endonuclease Cas1 n=1 Tax=Thermobrachium celere DSM 8682 TaxID=941824 RepID=R7RT49_9CLOT|nr:CRISPR-associated endonuclease Cas1 [Thermobrachium celere]CDF59224.1 CRISPR-associated protein Cas1 [Thermobrachium celere DSM 8682]
MNTLFIDQYNGQISKSGEVLFLKDINTEIKLLDVDDIVILSRATLTTPAVHFLMDKKIYVHFLTQDAKYKGSIIPPLGKNINLRVIQYKAYDSNRLYLAKRFIFGKVKNQITMLYRWQKIYNKFLQTEIDEIKSIKAKILEADNIEELMGYEGIISRIYFEAFRKVIPEEFTFNSRSRRPPKDEINALLSYTYTIFLTKCISSLITAGLDPYLGFLHSCVYGRPALALDMLEEIRPIADAFVLNLIRNGEIEKGDFEEKLGAYYLNSDARLKYFKRIKERFERQTSHVLAKEKIPFQKVILLQSRMLVKYLIGDFDEYIPYTFK